MPRCKKSFPLTFLNVLFFNPQLKAKINFKKKKMPKIRTLQTKRAPAGWDFIEPTLTEMLNLMRDAENEPHEGKRKIECAWKIIKLHN